MAEIGGVRVPVVAKGGSWLAGGDLAQVAEFLVLDFETRSALPAAVLLRRLRHILATAMRLTGQFPERYLAETLPNRDRTLLDLANHVVEIARGFLLVEAGRDFDAQVAGAIGPQLDRNDLATRARSVAARLNRLQPDAERKVQTSWGASSLHRVLERCTWHAAQHTRQLVFMLRRFDIEPDRPLTATDLAGLPVPEAVWDDV